VPPGLAASPFFSAEPAVPAPWVLASFADGIELVELPVVASVPLEPPPVAGVCCVVSLLGLVAAGPPDVELPPADVPPLLWASAREFATVKAAASKYVVRFMKLPPIVDRYRSALTSKKLSSSSMFLRYGVAQQQQA
jgi:hypothetical protein